MEKRLQQYREILKQDWMLNPVSEKLYKEMEEENVTRKTIMLYVMAPVMCMYVLWVLKEAMKSNKKRLYFLARDGYSMYQVAKIFCKQLDLPIECKYLYCSRYAWRQAVYHLLEDYGLDYICLGGIDVTLQKVMHRAGLSDEEGMQIAKLLQREEEYQKVLSYQQLQALKPLLTSCEPFMKKLRRLSMGKYPYVCGYLEQEGLTEEGWAIVDSGWTGSMQKTLRRILRSMGYDKRIEGYYFGMYEYPQGVDIENYHTWYFQPESHIRRKVYFSNSLFECIFSAPEGMTIGYNMNEEMSYPLLEHIKNANFDKLAESTWCLQEYARQLVALHGAEILNRKKNDTKTAFALLYHFMGKPVVEEAMEYGSYVFCDDVIGEANQTVAAPLTKQDIQDNRFLYKATNFLRKKGRAVHESAWLEGSIMLCKEAGKEELWHCAVYKYILYLRKLIK